MAVPLFLNPGPRRRTLCDGTCEPHSCGLAGLLDVCGCAGAGAAHFRFGGGAELGEFAFEVVHAGDGLGGGVVGLLAVGACVVALGLGVPAALDLFGKAGLGGGPG